MADDDYTPHPLHLWVLQCLLESVAPAWCVHNLPMPTLEQTDCLARALEISLGISEVEQCLHVKQVLGVSSVKVSCALDKWLQQTGLTQVQYMAAVSNVGTAPDGLFIWLVVQCLGVHLNLIHSNGIWSTRRSSIPDLCNPVIIFVFDHYLAAPGIHMVMGECEKDKLSTLETVYHPKCFGDPLDNLDHFIPSLPNLNHPIKSLEDKCDEISLITFGDPALLQELLADLVQVSHKSYRASLMSWLHMHQANLPPIFNWLASCGLILDDYVSHMLDSGHSDGLELWLLCVASDINVNIVQEDHIWSAKRSGVDFADPIFILTNYGMVVACLPEDREQEQGVTPPQAPLDVDPHEKRPQGGRPLASTAISTSDASTPST